MKLRRLVWGPPRYRARISWRALLTIAAPMIAGAFLIEYTVPPSALHDVLAWLCILVGVALMIVLERRAVLRERRRKGAPD